MHQIGSGKSPSILKTLNKESANSLARLPWVGLKHRLVELGLKDQAQDPARVTVLEAEKVDPLPPLSDLVVIQAVFSITLVSKVLSPRDLGQFNLGSRPGAAGHIPEIVLIDTNGWEQYDENQHAVFPNMRKATGFWKMVEKFDAGLKQTLCAIVQTHHNDLAALNCGPQGLCAQPFEQGQLLRSHALSCSAAGAWGLPRRPPEPICAG